MEELATVSQPEFNSGGGTGSITLQNKIKVWPGSPGTSRRNHKTAKQGRVYLEGHRKEEKQEGRKLTLRKLARSSGHNMKGNSHTGPPKMVERP